MIFVTVGVQLPFDRLIRAVDEWALSEGRDDIVAQIGKSNYVPKRFPSYPSLPEADFRKYVQEAEAVVSHAGMGSIITALELGKPIIVMPRRAELGEHRNDHQLATARHMAEQRVVSVASDERELREMLENLGAISANVKIAGQAKEELISFISEQISQVPARSGWNVWSRFL